MGADSEMGHHGGISLGHISGFEGDGSEGGKPNPR